MSKIPNQPLENIAISLSGGGYRATSFHLGALFYLNKINHQGKPLIENIKTISTVSGGTITGVVYALMRAKGHTFVEVYDFLYKILQNLDLLKEGIMLLNDENLWKNGTKTRNLINALARKYDEHFTQGATFNIFEDLTKCHLDEVIFNATEFDTGINFRFKNQGVFGNNYHRISKVTAQEVKLGDIIAASSCFPGGFEPLAFPKDFQYPEAENLHSIKDKYPNDLGLMDGGIYDNQGIDSIMLSENNKTQKNYYDLVIVSDVTSPDFSSFKFTETDNSLNTLSYKSAKDSINRKIRWSKSILIFVVALGVLLAYSKHFDNHWLTGVGLTLSVVALLMYFGLSIVLNWSQSKLTSTYKSIRDMIPSFMIEKLESWDLTSLSMKEAKPLIFDRFFSIKTLVENVFLKRIRQLQFSKIYENPNFKYRRISNLIKDLTEANFKKPPQEIKNLPDFPKELKGTYEEVIGSHLHNLSKEASSFGTTLWFTPDDQINEVLDKLLACGQATMCYNLLIYLTEMILTPNNGFENLDAIKQNEIIDLHQRCLFDWKKFKEKPMSMVHSNSQLS